MTVQISNVSFQYDATPLLAEVSMEIRQGECVALFGPNGRGKTTLLKLMMGFLHPEKGVVLIDGRRPLESRQRMGYVPQVAQLDRQFPITVLDVVKMGALTPRIFGSYPKGSAEKAMEMLAKVGLEQVAAKPFGSLSGGQLQRVLIARALMGEPSFLFLDEATANVDVAAEEAFHALLKQLKGSLTIVLVTHDLPGVMSYIDRFFCVYGNVTPYSPSHVCDHFAQGLYHTPLRERP